MEKDLAGNLTMKAYREREALRKVLDYWYEFHANGDLELAHGGANGADTLAQVWAESNYAPCQVFEADWGHGKMAGPVRNLRMLMDFAPDFVLQFPGGRGTENCVMTAKRMKIPVVKVTV